LHTRKYLENRDIPDGMALALTPGQEEGPMTPKLMALAAVVVLTVVFLSPVAYMAGQRATIWLTAPAGENGPWPSVDEAEREQGPTERAKPPVRPGFGDI
jgi:hypothetical protein